MAIKLRLPLKNIEVNQPFGKNYLDFYQQWGLKGHNGTDLRAFNGFNCYSSTEGIVTVSGKQSDGGIEVEVWDKTQGVKTIYYHLKDTVVNVGQSVHAGELIGHCDNTGKYTTGDHLHFGLKQVNSIGNTMNYDNGYNGAIDPSPYFCYAYNGQEISPKDCYKPNAYHRYYRGRPKGGLWIERYKVVPALIKKLGHLPSNEQINACTYGGWDWQAVDNIGMYQNWAYLKKDEFIDGEKAFQTKD